MAGNGCKGPDSSTFYPSSILPIGRPCGRRRAKNQAGPVQRKASSSNRPGPPAAAGPSLLHIVPVLGVTQILAWASSYYLPAVLAQPIANSTGWPLSWVV